MSRDGNGLMFAQNPRIDVVITSPFHRCVQTAAAIIEVLPMRNGKKACALCRRCAVEESLTRLGGSQVPILIDCEIAEALSLGGPSAGKGVCW